MIQVFVFRVVCALQGGLCMVSRSSSPDAQVPPVQVWPALSHGLRTRIVGLLAQLALKVVVARPASACTAKEVACAQPTPTPKNPS